MKVLVVSYIKRLVPGMLEWRLIRSFLRLGLDVYVWAHDYEGLDVQPIYDIQGRPAHISKECPYGEKFDLIFFASTCLPSVPLYAEWFDTPMVYVGLDAWGKGTRWDTMKSVVETFGKLYRRNFPIDFWAVSDGVAEDIREVTQLDVPVTVIEGRVPDEVFLVPEEFCVSPNRKRRNMITWVGYMMKERTYKVVWSYIVSEFKDMFLVLVDNDPFYPPDERKVIPYVNIDYLSCLRLIYQSEVVVAPYTHKSYHPYQNPLKYWETISLNTPFIVTNVEMLKDDEKCLCAMVDDEETAAEFVINSIKKVIAREVLPPFKSSQELSEWRRKHWFTAHVGTALKGVIEKWNLKIPSQLSQFLDTVQHS